MSDLLNIGRSGVLAYRDALSGISENVVNANNDGFARRQVTIKEATTSSGPLFLSKNSMSFLGVQPASVARIWDQYKATTAWSANSDDAMASTRSQYLGTIETTLDDSDAGVGVKLTSIFTSVSALAANPDDTTLRQGVIASIGDAAGTLGQVSANLQKVANTVSDRADSLMAEVNTAVVALSRLNTALKTSPQGTSGRAALEDQRDLLIGTISTHVAVDVTFGRDGTASLRLNGYSGEPLVSSELDMPATLGLARSSDGRLSMRLTNTTGLYPVGATSGTIAGLVSVSNAIADRRGELDTLAGTLATTVNDWQANGVDAAGVAGVPLLTGTTAMTLKLTAAATPAAIAASDGTAANGNLLALPNKVDVDGVSVWRGPTGVESMWRDMVSNSALQTASAKSQAKAAATQKDSAYAALDSSSGVDLDAEAADLMRYQQAYSASAKIIQTARETLQAVLNLF